MKNLPRTRAVTLIEILVAVAIIAILAAIAIPNLQGAQVRSKVARTRNDFRVLAGALEAYRVDHGSYPLCNAWAVAGARPSLPGDPPVLERLSTPTAYLTSALLPSPFHASRFSGPNILGVGPVDTNYRNWPATNSSGVDAHLYRTYQYTAVGADDTSRTGLSRAQIDILPVDRRRASAYIIQSPGPMGAQINMGGVVTNSDREYSANLLYDPTNGSLSFGNLFRAGGSVEGEDNIITFLRNSPE